MEGLEKPDFDELSTREGYDRWARIYDDEDNALIALEEPRVRALLGDVRGLEVVDIGCGTGRWALPLAAAGAVVTAVDFAPEMMSRARRKACGSSIRFVEHDLTTPLPFGVDAFDRVLCCLVLDHIGDLPRFFAELERICRRSGEVIVSVMHPAMMLRGIQARFTDPQTGRETRPQSYANRISDYVMAALSARLRLLAMEEHSVDQSLAERSPRARKYLGWPMLLVMRLAPAS